MGIARGTVEAAYGLLQTEGYIQTRGPAGTIVSLNLQLPARSRGETPTVSTVPAVSMLADHAAHKPGMASNGSALPFQMGLPALDSFPRKIWARLAAQAIRATGQEDMLYPPAEGLRSLRQEIATYLQIARGVTCQPEQVFITAGYRETLQLFCTALLKTQDQVWTDDPGYPATAQVLTHAGMRAVAVAVDDEGLQVAQEITLAPTARTAIVTPAHQSPMCVALSLQRRLDLLEWATRQQAWIIEDDYDGEYRYQSRPLPALKSLDDAQRVLYAGTFSKVLFPEMRLAYLVVPPSQVPTFQTAARKVHSGAPLLTQKIVHQFIAQGHFARHLQRMRKLYGERRTHAANGLSKVLGNYLEIAPQPGGMHLILRLRKGLSDRAIAARMRVHGLAANALSERTIGTSAAPALLLGFTNIDSQATAERLAQMILRILQETSHAEQICGTQCT